MRSRFDSIVALTVLALSPAATAACTGLSLGENEPGQDTQVEPGDPADGEHLMGAIAIEPDEDQLWVVHQELREGRLASHLSAIDPETRQVTAVMDVSGTQDRRVIFPADDRMLLLAFEDGEDHLVLFDTDALEPIASRSVPIWFRGEQTSPSGRFLAVTDRAVKPNSYLIDLATLEPLALPWTPGTDRMKVTWNQTADLLLTVGVTALGESPTVRIRRHDLGDADLADGLPAPDLDLTLPGVDGDPSLWSIQIAVSPDDRWAVFTIRAGYRHLLFILDQTTGDVTRTQGRGPVGFLPDGSRIVTYDYSTEQPGSILRLVDPQTLDAHNVAIDVELPSFWVSHEHNEVIITSAAVQPDQPLLHFHYRADDDSLTPITGSGSVALLRDFVSPPGRDELWLATGNRVAPGFLYRVDLAADRLEAHPGPFAPASVNIRPGAGELDVGERRARIWRFDLDQREVAGPALDLTSPIDTSTLYDLPDRRRPQPATTAGFPSRPARSPFDPNFVAAHARARAPARAPGAQPAEPPGPQSHAR